MSEHPTTACRSCTPSGVRMTDAVATQSWPVGALCSHIGALVSTINELIPREVSACFPPGMIELVFHSSSVCITMSPGIPASYEVLLLLCPEGNAKTICKYSRFWQSGEISISLQKAWGLGGSYKLIHSSNWVEIRFYSTFLCPCFQQCGGAFLLRNCLFFST